MFDFDNFREIWSTIKKNKLRTFLTGFSVAWGIFMLIFLLGAGNGLRNGIMYNFRRFADNRIQVWTRYTSKPWKGMQENRRIRFKTEDYTLLPFEHSEVNLRSATISKNDTLTYNMEFMTGRTNGVYPDHAKINKLDVYPGEGRFINELDIKERRKVLVLPPRMKEVLFKDKDPLGKYVKCGQLMLQVVGVYHEQNLNNDAPAFMPFTTAQQLYSQGNSFNNLVFTIKGVTTEEENNAFEERFRERMARRHNFDPSDKSAVGIWNTSRELRMVNGLMNGIVAFIWIVGIGTLMAGIVGVSNIMLITVKERTREFGIRKALGAKPSSILKLVIFESILITAIFGYVGMLLGIGITEAVNTVMMAAEAAAPAVSGNEGPGGNMTMFRNPTVSLSIAVASTILLVGAGVIAGYYPARRATKVSPIEAMRAE
jgi:putative ABC transport system permease protein